MDLHDRPGFVGMAPPLPRCRCAGRPPQGFRRHGGARLHARAEPGAGASGAARHRRGGAARRDLPRLQDAGIAVHPAARRRRDHRHGLSPGRHVAGREPGDRTADRGRDPPCLPPGHAHLLAHRHQRGGDRSDAAERERPVHLLRPPKGLADRRRHAAHEAGTDRRHRKGRTPRLRRSEFRIRPTDRNALQRDAGGCARRRVGQDLRRRL